jgi:hypothetical protein
VSDAGRLARYPSFPPAPLRALPSKVFDVNLRHGLAAAALLSTAVFTVACAAPTAGTPAAGSSVVSATSSSSAAPSTSSPASTAPSSSSAAPTSPASVTLIDDSSVADPGTPTIDVQPAELDATTGIWLQNSCTDVGVLFASLFAIPTVGETAPLEEFRAAYRDYYAALADTALGITDRMSRLDPPTIEGGQALHDGYLTYLTGLADIAAGGAIAIDVAPDAASIAAIVEQIEFETDQLGQSDNGLADFQGQELQALMAQIPACQDLLVS